MRLILSPVMLKQLQKMKWFRKMGDDSVGDYPQHGGYNEHSGP
jgi:hypothetical protein